MADLGNTNIYGNANVTRSIQNGAFFSGFTGSGWRIDQGLSIQGQSSAEFDNLTIRGTLRSYEMLINKIRATNGSLLVSSVGKVASATKSDGNWGADGSVYVLTIEEGTSHGFEVGDLIRAKRTSTIGGYDVKMQVTAAPAGSFTANLNGAAAYITGEQSFIGMEFVRVGHTTNVNRQGSVYITSDDTNAPYIDIKSEVYTHALFNDKSTTKVRLGLLTGLTYNGSNLSGYGLYSDNAYLEGSINAKSGYIGGTTGWSISSNVIEAKASGVIRTASSGSRAEISSGGISLYNGSSQRALLKSDGSGWLGAIDKILWSTAGAVTVGGWTINSTDITSSSLTLASGSSPSIRLGAESYEASGIWLGKSGSTWKLSLVGGNHALKWSGTELDITGKITATTGKIGNWELAGNAISTSNFGSVGGIILAAPTTAGANYIRVTKNNAPNTYIDLSQNGLTAKNDGTPRVLIGIDGAGWLGKDDLLHWTNAGALTVGGWTINSTSIANSSHIVLDASNKRISLASPTFGTKGIQIDYNGGSPMFYVGAGGANHFIKFSGTNLSWQGVNTSLTEVGKFSASDADISGKITASSGAIGGFYLSGDNLWAGEEAVEHANTKVVISSANQKIALGATANSISETTGTGVFLGGAGTFKAGSTTNYVKFDGTDLSWQSGNTKLTTAGALTIATGYIGGATGWTIGANTLSTSSSSNSIRGVATALFSNNTGFYLQGDGKFRFGTVAGGVLTKGIAWDTSNNFQIKADNFTLASDGKITATGATITGTVNATGGYFGSAANGVSVGTTGLSVVGTGKITAGDASLSSTGLTISGTASSISIGSGNSIVKINNASGLWLGNAAFDDAKFSVTMGGKVKATDGTIGGWTINSTSITSANGKITLDPSGQHISVGSSSNTAGISGNVTSADATAFWAGSAIGDREGTPWDGTGPAFKVTYAGQLYAKNAYISGTAANSVGIGYGVQSYGAGDVAIGSYAMKDSTPVSSGEGQFNVAIGGYALKNKTTGKFNIALGHLSLRDLTSGSYNIAIGYSSMPKANDSNYNIAIGYLALQNTTAGYNIGIGLRSLDANTTGTSNVGIGYYSLFHNATGSRSVAIGRYAMQYFLKGVTTEVNADNVAIGTEALQGHTNGQTAQATNNTAIGYRSMFYNVSGYQNVAIGSMTMFYNESGGQNVAIGYQCLRSNEEGKNNVAVGSQCLWSNKSGSYNIAMGEGAMYTNVAQDRSIAIGFQAMYYANSSTTSANSNNIAVGYQALRGRTVSENNTGEDNVAIGTFALFSNTIGSYNVAMGSSCLTDNREGQFNVAIGWEAMAKNRSRSRSVAIGYQAMSKAMSSLVIENADNIAIGYQALYGSDSTASNSGISNVAIGSQALLANKTGNYNVGIGTGNLSTNTSGSFNIGIGSYCLYYNTIGGSNVAIGYQAMNTNTSGGKNVAIGDKALQWSSTGSSNIAIGSQCLQTNSTGQRNIAIGTSALQENGSGSDNIAIGDSALFDTNSSSNIAIGYCALQRNTTGEFNVAIGNHTLRTKTSGDKNIAIGESALYGVTTGQRNIAIGFNALRSTTTGAGNIAIGDQAGFDNTTGSNQVWLGSTSVVTTYLYGNVTIPSGKKYQINGVNLSASDVGAATRARYTASITTTWSGSSAPYTQNVSVSGILATDDVHITVNHSTTNATAILQQTAWNCVGKAVTAANSITFTCFEEKPVTAIPIIIEVIR